MPSGNHEALVEMVRAQPGVVADLLCRLLKVRVPAHEHVRLESADLSQLRPTELRADAVIGFSDARGDPVLAVIVEVQRSRDDKKRYSWPAYVATLRARLKCAVMLVVIACDEATEQWCRRSIPLGHPGLILIPLVVGPKVIPAMTDSAEVAAQPWLAVLSALAHHGAEERDGVFGALIDGIDALGDEEAEVYIDIVLAGLPDLARRHLEALMATGTYEFKSDFMRNLQARAIAEGRAKGEAEGRAKGEAKGEAKAIVGFLVARGLAVPAPARDRIMACTDPEQLGRWITRAATVTRVDDLFV